MSGGRSKKLLVGVTAILILCMLAPWMTKVPTASAHFIISSWDFPMDEYGQGLEKFKFYENSTGDWLPMPYYTHYYPDYHETLGEFYLFSPSNCPREYFINWSVGMVMKLQIYSSVLNASLVGAVSEEDGKNYFRHTIVVKSATTVVFSQQNCSLFIQSYEYEGMYYYRYDVILNFLPQAGNIYTITVIYEVFY